MHVKRTEVIEYSGKNSLYAQICLILEQVVKQRKPEPLLRRRRKRRYVLNIGAPLALQQ